jgi:flagellin
VSDLRVGAAKYAGSSLDISIAVTASAQQGGVFLSAGGTSINLGAGSTLVLEVAGSLGARELAFSSGTSLAAMRSAINTYSTVTGVEATVSGTGLVLKSSEYGAQQFVAVRVLDAGGINSTANGDAGTPTRGVYQLNATNMGVASTASGDFTAYTSATNAVRDFGRDVQATVNGVRATSSGRSLRVNSDFLELDVTLSASAAQSPGMVGGSNPAFIIAGGGAEFSLNSKVDISSRVSLGVQEVASNRLGNSALGYLASLGSGKTNNLITGDLTQSQKVVSEAIRQVSTLRGRLGNFQKSVLGATARNLAITAENTAAAESVIRDADFAFETAQLTRSQILVNASTNILSLANQAPNAALQLLG